MTSVPLLDFNHHVFLDRTTILYGESDTGKSTIITDILHELKPFVDQIIVFCPTDRNTNAYSGKTPEERLVPLPCIHYQVKADILNAIWERQDALSAVYRRASAPATLAKLFRRVAPDQQHIIDSIAKKRDAMIAEIGSSIIDPVTAGRKCKEIMADSARFTEVVYKHFINNNQSRLRDMRLDDEEAFALKFLNLNPRLVLIFDDCTDQLDKLKNNPIIQKLGNQGRHAKITGIIACHTDKSIDSSFRKNSNVSFFTEDSCARAYFNRGTNDLDKESKAIAMSALQSVMTPDQRWQKLVWVRGDKRFYRYTAKLHDSFMFGCPEVWNFCDTIGASGGISKSNRFIHGLL